MTGAHVWPVAESLRRSARALRSEAGPLDPTSDIREELLKKATIVDTLAELYETDEEFRVGIDNALKGGEGPSANRTASAAFRSGEVNGHSTSVVADHGNLGATAAPRPPRSTDA